MLIESGLDRLDGLRESRRCSGDTYPQSCITEYTLVYEEETGHAHAGDWGLGGEREGLDVASDRTENSQGFRGRNLRSRVLCSGFQDSRFGAEVSGFQV